MKQYKKLANDCRKKVLDLVHKAGTSHIASNFSVIDIATVLYENLQEGDEVVWSKGWAAATIYYFLWKQGKITEEQLSSFPNAPFLGLAETTVNGMWCNGGSVGHGLPIACGMALGKKRAREKGTIYCIMSDGELNEGSVWEAAMFAAHHELDNLVAIIDKNGWQAMGRTEDVIKVNEKNAFGGFGWESYEGDGHDCQDIYLKVVYALHKDRPTVLIFNTIKGKGVSFMENHLLYHYAHIDKETYDKALAELNA